MWDGWYSGPWSCHGKRRLWLERQASLLRWAPSQCPQRSKPVEGDGNYNCSPAPCSPLISDALLLWCPGHFLQTFLVVELFALIPSGCLFTANSCSLSGSALQTPLFSTNPHSTTRDTQLKLLGFAELQCGPCTQFLLFPAFHRLSAALSFNPMKISFCPSWFPHCEGIFLSVGNSSHLQLPIRVADPFWFPIPFFCPTLLWG